MTGKAASTRRAKSSSAAVPVRFGAASQMLAVPWTDVEGGDQEAARPNAAPLPMFHFGKIPLQAKLTVGPERDAFEKDADAAAERVMRMPDPSAAPGDEAGKEGEDEKELPGGAGMVQRKCDACAKEELQRKAAGGAVAEAVAPPAVHEVLRSPGAPLDTGTRAFMEPRFGQDFGGVRVHTDARAAESAAAVGARAYTVGQHVVFGAGSYSAGSAWGRHLLAHELAHVVQQGRATGAVVRRWPSGSEQCYLGAMSGPEVGEVKRKLQQYHERLGDKSPLPAWIASIGDSDRLQDPGKRHVGPAVMAFQRAFSKTRRLRHQDGAICPETLEALDEALAAAPEGAKADDTQGGQQPEGTGTAAQAPPIEHKADSAAAGPAEAQGVSRVKWAPDIEYRWRRMGETRKADAIRRCRTEGKPACDIILTDDEFYRAWAATGGTLDGIPDAASVAGGARAPWSGALAASAPSRRLGGSPAQATLGGAALAGTLALPQGALGIGAGTAGAGTAGTAAGAAGVGVLAEAAPPIALGAYAVGAAVMAAQETEARDNFLRKGYVLVGGAEMASCPGGCHLPNASQSLPQLLPGTADPDVLREWITHPYQDTTGIEKKYNLEQQEQQKEEQQEDEEPDRPPTTGPTTGPRPTRRCLAPTGLTRDDPIPMNWYKPTTLYPRTITLDDPLRTGAKITFRMCCEEKEIPGSGDDLGVKPENFPAVGKVVERTANDSRRESDRFKEVLALHGFKWTDLDPDHVQDLAFGGDDAFDNLWPLDASSNRSSGSQNAGQLVTYCLTPGAAAPRRSRINQDAKLIGRFFVIKAILPPGTPPGTPP